MLSTESGTVLRLTVSPSRYLLLSVSLIHLVALCSVGMIAISVPWQVVLILLIWLSGVLYWFRYWEKPRIRAIEWYDSERIIIHDHSSAHPGNLHRVYCHYPWLVSFSVLDDQGRKHTCLLLKDQTDPDTFRRLSVQLRLANSTVADAA